FEQVHPHSAGPFPDEVFLPQRNRLGRWRRRLFSLDQEQNRPDHLRRGHAPAAVGRADHAAAAGRGNPDRPPDGREVSGGAEDSLFLPAQAGILILGGNMAVEFTGRNVPVTSNLKALAEERLQKLERRLGGSAQIRVVLSQEKHRFGAEVIATHRRRLWKAQEETGDPRAALALAFEKIDAQAMRHVERRRDRKHRGAPAAAPRQEEGVGRRDGSGTLEWRIVRTPQRSAVKPMSIEEAALRLDSSALEFLVFRDSGTEKISILYKRRDGDFGLILPQC